MPDTLPPLPQPLSPAERRALALDLGGVRPEELMLMLSGEPALHETGAELPRQRLARQQAAMTAGAQQFEQPMRVAQESRERAQLQLARQQLEMGRYEFVRNPLNPAQMYVYDKLTHHSQLVDFTQPNPLGSAGRAGGPAGGAPAAAPAPPARPPGGPPGPLGTAGGTPGTTPPPQAPLGPAAAGSGGPQLRVPSPGEFVENEQRGKLTRGIAAKAAALDQAGAIIKDAHDLVRSTPEAFGPLPRAVAALPGVIHKPAESLEKNLRSPEEVKARAAVSAANRVIAELFAAEGETPDPEHLPAELVVQPNDPPRNILAKLEQAYSVAKGVRDRFYKAYFPLTSPEPYPVLGAGTPAAKAAPAQLPAAQGGGAPTGYVRLRAPTGEEANVRQDRAQKYLQRGYQVVR